MGRGAGKVSEKKRRKEAAKAMDRQRPPLLEADTIELGPRAADALAVDTGGQSATSATRKTNEGRRA